MIEDDNGIIERWRHFYNGSVITNKSRWKLKSIITY